jgi:translation initiation factor IF-2
MWTRLIQGGDKIVIYAHPGMTMHLWHLFRISSGPLELKLIIKADVSGSAEADSVRDALHGIGNASAIAQVISTGVGEITESDVMMAKAANGDYSYVDGICNSTSNAYTSI